jgi:hypothetical protein
LLGCCCCSRAERAAVQTRATMAKDTNTNQASQAEVRLPAGGPPACLPPARLPAGYPVLQLRSTPGDGCAAWQRDLQPHACCAGWD